MQQFIQKMLFAPPEGIVASLLDIQEWCGLKADDVLENIDVIRGVIDEYDLVLEPPLRKGSLEEKRRLGPKHALVDLRALIERGEGPGIEFKSTAFFDVKHYLANPDLNPLQYLSAKVSFSSVKTIAAFLNSNGGTLLVGVDDDGNILGIERDFGLKSIDSVDKWELKFRDLLASYFHQGTSVNRFVGIEFVSINERTVARVSVAKGYGLHFTKGDSSDSFQLFLRLGNRTQLVRIEEMPNYFRIEPFEETGL